MVRYEYGDKYVRSTVNGKIFFVQFIFKINYRYAQGAKYTPAWQFHENDPTRVSLKPY